MAMAASWPSWATEDNPMHDSSDDLLTQDRLVDPYPILGHWRETEPVRWNELYKAWFIHRYDDVHQALRDPRFSSDRVGPVFEKKLTSDQRASRAPTYQVLANWMVFKDPPEHTRLRSLVSRAFTPRAIEGQR